jgi:hypothetical protein
MLAFVTSDRAGMETQIAQDCIDLFVDLLDKIGPTKRISLLLHTNGGQTAAAWRLINLIRTFCDELEVLIPLKALSAGTLISLGADKIVMTKQAALDYQLVRGLVESTAGGCYGFLSEGTLTQVAPQPDGPTQISDQRTFRGMEENRMKTIFRTTADDSATFRERTGSVLARSTSSADTGNLAAVTKNSTFQSDQPEAVVPTERPQPGK